MADPVTSTLLQGVPHAFSTREESDLPAILPDGVLVRVRQIHSARAVFAAEAMARSPEADAIVTDRRGLLLGIVTADCAPVLLCDSDAGVVGAAHAGWRGALGGVIANTVAAMEKLGAAPRLIAAAIGPTIAQASYEVDDAFRKQFTASEDARFFADGRPGHWQFDLPAYVVSRLQEAGVERIDDCGEDTYAQPDRFHSFRRATHQGEETTGRQLSVIGLR